MELRFDASDFDRFGNQAQQAAAAVPKEMQVANAALLTEGISLMQGFAPHEDGDLRNSIKIFTGPTPEGGSFGSAAIHAKQRNYGGTITAKKGKFLRFMGRDGEFVFVREVYQEGAHFKRKTEQALKPKIRAAHKAAIARVLAIFGGG